MCQLDRLDQLKFEIYQIAERYHAGKIAEYLHGIDEDAFTMNTLVQDAVVRNYE